MAVFSSCTLESFAGVPSSCNDRHKSPVALTITDIVLELTFHMLWNLINISSYVNIFPASFFISLLSVCTKTSDSEHIPFLTRNMCNCSCQHTPYWHAWSALATGKHPVLSDLLSQTAADTLCFWCQLRFSIYLYHRFWCSVLDIGEHVLRK